VSGYCTPQVTQIYSGIRVSSPAVTRERVAISTRLFGSGTGQFRESVVIDAEVVAELVDDGSAYLLDNLDAGAADGADDSAIDGDPVGQHTGIVRRAADQGTPETESGMP
jgi:hypothetical protein